MNSTLELAPYNAEAVSYTHLDVYKRQDNTHISEFTPEYETQSAANARHNPSAFATFAAHIDEQKDRPRNQRYGLGDGRPL